ncbi:MAG: hypothetical protein Q8L11_02740 [Candidatus Moranbacteria bacterium]|nr:hypothetical protein [bacterium]MDP1833825.1 hypothetical protein [Candidatus Moranbacteria bacterium]
MEDITTIIRDSKDAINFWDDTEAKKLLKKIASFTTAQNLTQTDPNTYQKLQKLSLYLKIVAFPGLPDEESAEILRNHYLESFEIDVPMENRLVGKLFFVPYAARDDLRRILKQALLENRQRLGNLTLGQWIQEFEKTFNIHTRTKSAPVEFVSRHPQAILLNPIERRRLKEIIHTYDYLLVSTLPTTEPELSEMLANMPDTETSEKQDGSARATYAPESYRKSFSGNSTSADTAIIPLDEILKQFPEIGEQIITSNRIQILSFPEPARPSIKNWLADYTSILGNEPHDSIARGNYLFHEKNTQNLSSTNRNRLAYILKSFDEKTPITMDKSSKQIIFDDTNEIPEPRKNDQNSQNTSTQKTPTANYAPQTNKISFSSPQKLSFEKITPPAKTATVPANLPTGNLARPAQFGNNQPGRMTNQQPYRITPSGSRQQIVDTKAMPRVLPKNVVNLRD